VPGRSGRPIAAWSGNFATDGCEQLPAGAGGVNSITQNLID
jgi:hypothetical protein